MYTLTGTWPVIGCYGTSFATFESAQKYALTMQELGLCIGYAIGQYQENGHARIFEQKPPNNEIN